MKSPNPGSGLPFGEFVTLMALMMALVALSIDAMLPALPAMGADLGVAAANDNQLIISILFLGLAFGQMLYGPLSDSVGRKPAVYLGLALFVIGCLLSIMAVDLRWMLVGRFLQGLGLAGPRVVSVALIRDQYEGRAMARVMSFVYAVFIFVPIVAPALGQAILWVAEWRAIFVTFLVLTVLIWIWFAMRQGETLSAEARVPFTTRRIVGAVREICGHRAAFGYTVTAGLVSSAFLGYLSTAQQIFQQQYGLGDRFPLVFAALALAVGSASFFNGKVVMRFGMQLMSTWSLRVLTGLSILFSLGTYALGGLSFWWLMLYLAISLFCIGILFGNLNALAMEPLGHIVGIGAAVVGSLVTFISVPFGVLIGRSYDGTALPLLVGFAVCALLSMLTMRWAEAH